MNHVNVLHQITMAGGCMTTYCNACVRCSSQLLEIKNKKSWLCYLPPALIQYPPIQAFALAKLPNATATAHSGFAPQPDLDVDTTSKDSEIGGLGRQVRKIESKALKSPKGSHCTEECVYGTHQSSRL